MPPQRAWDEATEVCVFTVVGRRVVVLYTGLQGLKYGTIVLTDLLRITEVARTPYFE